MKEFVEKLMDWLANHHRVVKKDEDVEWNRAIYSCEEEVKRLAEEYSVSANDQDMMIVASLPSLYPMMQPFEVEAINRVVCSAKHSGGWIPCSEKLPKKNKVVLCWVVSTTIASGETFIIGSCDRGFWFLQTYEIGHHHFPVKDYEVVAWQPLPDPYIPK